MKSVLNRTDVISSQVNSTWFGDINEVYAARWRHYKRLLFTSELELVCLVLLEDKIDRGLLQLEQQVKNKIKNTR